MVPLILHLHKRVESCTLSAAVAKWLWCLTEEPKDAGSNSAMTFTFSMDAEMLEAHVLHIVGAC